MKRVIRSVFGNARTIARKLAPSALIASLGVAQNAVAQTNLPSGGANTDTSGGFADVVRNFGEVLVPSDDLILGASFVIGAALTIKGALAFKKAKETDQQAVTFASAAIQTLSGLGIAFLPSLMASGGETFGFSQTGSSQIGEFDN